MNMNKKFTKSNMMLAFIALIAVVLVVALAGFFLLTPPEETIMGQAEATTVRISGKVPGRIAEYRFGEGDQVKTLNGARAQEITAAYELWQKAKAGLEIARKSYDRVRNLYEKGVMSAQKKDEAEANYNAMVATEKAARSQYEMAKEGARKEDKAAAEALVQRADGAIAEVESYIEESILLSPIDGEVTERFPERGELVGTGAPIMNIADLHDMWVTFSVREDLLKDLKVGNQIEAFIPALENQSVTLQVYYLKDMGTYAAWKATKTTGQFDAKTFEVRARPTEPVNGLRPGMSVILKR